MSSRSETTEPSPPPPTQPEAPLQAVLEAFRAAATGSISEALEAARDDPRVQFGELPAFGIDGLEVELNVGVEWQEDKRIRLLFDPSPHAASRIKFRVQPLPMEAVHRPRIEITELYDPAGISGRHQHEVRITDDKNAPVGNAPLILRIVRADKPRGQEKRVQFQATPDGIATFVVDAMGRTVQVGEEPKERLPARDAVSWRFVIESVKPSITSDPIVISRPGRRNARAR